MNNFNNVETFKNTFDHLQADDVSGIDNWNLESATSFDNMFYKASKMPNWSGNWMDDGTYVK